MSVLIILFSDHTGLVGGGDRDVDVVVCTGSQAEVVCISGKDVSSTTRLDWVFLSWVVASSPPPTGSG